ncbi:2-hydroxy-3-oxopropionate reductase [Ceratocystis fimbriata CBS 114723]|uniref:2-hydroxy-3-oxopropionate reductase n=1 Tax=Ceratocystis fimbriata CBS 114723 TaxID=1035309 RepID=A0A2C5X2Q7_9PEZI|nr:2-hydroxy-3-oxopropionate reductase [Ceratocystis fimbriata CBS 114723]
MAPRLLWIGLGNMGRGITKNIVAKAKLDAPLLIFNRSPQRCADLAAILPSGSIEIANSVTEGVAAADIIFTCLANDAAMTETIDQALSGPTPVTGKTFVDCSTIHPDTTEAIAAKILAAGAQFVTSPVFGAPAMADAGQLIAVLAGPKEAIARVKPYYTGVMARAEIDLSDRPYSAATTLKIIGNTFILNMIEQLAEGLVVAEKSGLGTAPLQEFVNQMFPGPYAAYAQRMVGGDYHQREEPLFAVDLARKDAGHALNIAKEAGVRLANVETADAHLVQVKEKAGEKGDIAAIYGAVRQESGLKYENS